jgi:hypothetical protein
MRRIVTVAVTLTVVLALAASAHAQGVTTQLGRTEQVYSHFNNPALGQFRVAVAGELSDTDGDGIADALGGATRMTKLLSSQTPARLQVDRIALQILNGTVWADVAINDQPANTGTALSVLQKTPRVGFCATSTLTRRFRIRQAGSVRWADGLLGRQTQFSAEFRTRMLNDDPSCP